MKRALAFLSYYVGLCLAIGGVFWAGRQAGLWELVFVPLYGLPLWWIAAGIGIRLGVYPSELFRTLATAAGLLEPPAAREDRFPAL
jgi:hypothetical protein